LLNALERGYRNRRLWEAIVESEDQPGSPVLMCREVSIKSQATLPVLTGVHYARFAVLCARTACEGTRYEDVFGSWASGWLAGDDGSGAIARELADSLERDARPGQDLDLLTLPLPLMLANAARAAMHASKLPWLVGRGRDAENARAQACAAEAVHVAVRMTQLDLEALSEQAMPRPTARSVTPIPASAPLVANRILRALPT
jgi:hypothetical protein